ncbi:MAG: penicillin-binding protein 1A [Candidatus Azotimanducaceae bacterium]|jgi:penicillin-binding protein 1A
MNRILQIFGWTTFGLTSGLVLVLAAAFLYLNPQVPAASTFKDVKLRAPLRIYSADNKLIQEFGQRLIPITFEEIPPLFISALLDTEDKRFFEHSGIDLITVANASWQLIRNKGSIRTGASTITMQLVKNISGDTEIRFIRKFKEMLLALKIEQELSKEDILTLYLNMIPFGKHSFGIQAAANTYYGQNIADLTLAQVAMLAGVPQAPEAGNPVNGPKRALNRRNLVLLRMREQNSITLEQYEEAIAAPVTAKVYGREIELPALYVAEMVRKHLLNQFGNNAYNEGLIVRTTIDSHKQRAAEAAVTRKLNEYDRRHGYRGPEYKRIQGTDEFIAAPEYGYPVNWLSTLDNLKVLGDQLPGIVTRSDETGIELLTQDLQRVEITEAGFRWARPYIDVNRRGARPKLATELVNVGDVIRYEINEAGYWLGQVPDIQSALVSLDPDSGAILALVGGYDFRAQQYNHATQARRQPGSNFKPFFYAGAIENGLTAASIYNDAPVVLDGGDLEEVYRPSNVNDNFDGPLRLREALYKSKNLVSLRVILDYGPANAISYVSRFGFDTTNFPRDAQLAFGGGTIAITPLEVATGYAAFANGGHYVAPYFIQEIDSINEDVLFQADPPRVCADCETLAPRIMDPRVAYIVDSILADVMVRGTGNKAFRALQRRDLRGKTGTTNDADIWFSGYTRDLVTTIWAGFGNNGAVGSREYGSTVPLETWVDYVKEVLPPESETRSLPFPDRLVTLKIDPVTGLRTEPSDPNGIFEIFREEFAPPAALANQQDEIESQPLQQIF